MRVRILLTAFFLGMLLALSIFYEPPSPTAAVACTLNNEPCTCDMNECLCGDTTIDAAFCTQTLNTRK